MSESGVSTEWFLVETHEDTPQNAAMRFCQAGFDAFVPDTRHAHQGGALFPCHVLVGVGDLDAQEAPLRRCVPEMRIVNNDFNRPLCIPVAVAAALRDPDNETGQSWRNVLAAMAPEYRIDRFKTEIAAWY